MAVNQQQRQLIPFRAGTRQRFAPVATVPVSDDARHSVPMPRVGFASHVAVQLEVPVSIPADGASFAPLGPWNLLRRLTFRINLGTAVLYSTSGWTNYIFQRLAKTSFDVAGSGDADLYSAPTAAGSGTLVLTYLVPLAANFGSDFSVGLVNLQAPEVQATLDLEFGKLVGDAYQTSGVTYGTGPVARIGYWYYEVPDPGRVQYPPLTFHRILEEEVPITAGGELVYTVPREGVVLRLAHTLLSHGTPPARSNAVDSFVIRANKTDEIYRMRRAFLKQLQLYRYGSQLPTGVFVHDWWSASDEGTPGHGDTRDAISSEVLSTLEDILTLGSGFTAGENARLLVSREILQFVAL